jgi:hypothetical protein
METAQRFKNKSVLIRVKTNAEDRSSWKIWGFLIDVDRDTLILNYKEKMTTIELENIISIEEKMDGENH